MVESDSEDETSHFKSTTPPTTESIFKKRKNYLSWSANPAQMISDLSECQARAVQAKAEYDSVERDEERWAECMEIARTKLFTSYNACVGTLKNCFTNSNPTLL